MSGTSDRYPNQNETIDTPAALSFLAIHLGAAFVLMLGVSALTGDINVRGGAFLVAHGLAAALAYWRVVAPRMRGATANFEPTLERLAVTFALFAVFKHILLLVFGRAAAWLAGADRVLVWIVDVTFLNTSLLPDVAALGVIAAALRVCEWARATRRAPAARADAGRHYAGGAATGAGR